MSGGLNAGLGAWGPLASPLGAALALVLVGLLLRLAGWRRTARATVVFALIGLWLLATPAISNALLTRLEQRFAPTPVESSPGADAIVVLGGALRAPAEPWFQLDLGSGADRVWHAARLYRAGKAAKVIASGGGAGPEPEAVHLAWLLGELGVEPEDLLVETASTSTRQHALYTARLLEEERIARVLLVTSAARMRRALEAFRAVGIETHPAPTDYRSRHVELGTLAAWVPGEQALAMSAGAVREMLAGAYYRYRGWLDRPDPAPG